MQSFTRVLPCDASSISFADSGHPLFSSEETFAALKSAADLLVNRNQVVAFPTETVYGLGANALVSEAVSRIFSTKGRPPDNPLIVHVSSIEMLRSLLPPDYIMSTTYRKLIARFWPGALTLLFPADSFLIPSLVTANHSTVAIRMPSHPVARALIALANKPLAAPSANSSGKPSPTRANHVLRDLEGKIEIILDGGSCDIGLESTVVDGLNPDGHLRVLRPGGVTVEALECAVQESMLPMDATLHRSRVDRQGTTRPKVLVHKRDYHDEELEHAPTTPGMKYRHYSPAVPVILFMSSTSYPSGSSPITATKLFASLRERIHSDSKTLLRVGLLIHCDTGIEHILPIDADISYHNFDLGSKDDLAVNAARLFDGLLTLEKDGVDVILVEGIEEEREGLAFMNRVRKAASETIWLQLGA